MKNIGIKSRVIILGTIPALLFAIILAGYAISNVFGILNQSLLDRGRVIASQLAPAAEYGVISGNRVILQKLVQKVLAAESEVRTVLVLNNKGQILALNGPEISAELIGLISKQKNQEFKLDKGIVFTASIQRSLVEIDDFSTSPERPANTAKTAAELNVGQVYVMLSNQALNNLKLDLITKILMIGLFGLVLSSLIAWQIGRNITKPIQEIAQAVNKLGEGVFAQTIVESSSGELKTLQRGFNSM